MADVVNRGGFPGDPNADTAYAAFGKANDAFAALMQAAFDLNTALGNKQNASATLAALAVLGAGAGSLGLIEKTGADTFAPRAIGVGAGTSLLTRADGDGRYVAGPGSSTDNAAARFDLATGKLLQDSALLIADTTAALSRVGANTGIAIQGTNTNDAAAAGQIGEQISSVVLSGSAVALTNSVQANVTSISLTAGDWDVWANARFTGNAATTVAVLGASISLTSATMSNTPGQRANSFHNGQAPFVSTDLDLSVGAFRLSLASTTTVYLVALCAFATSTMSAYGALTARRRR